MLLDLILSAMNYLFKCRAITVLRTPAIYGSIIITPGTEDNQFYCKVLCHAIKFVYNHFITKSDNLLQLNVDGVSNPTVDCIKVNAQNLKVFMLFALT